jgi:hypothetical protein
MSHALLRRVSSGFPDACFPDDFPLKERQTKQGNSQDEKQIPPFWNITQISSSLPKPVAHPDFV